jgi:hypothetical protein
MPMPARTVLPAKLAAAEKHMGRRFLRCGKYMNWGGRRSVFLLGAMSGCVLVMTRRGEERRTGKSACATERRRTLARERQELAIVLRCFAGAG